MKKTLALILSFVMILALAACGRSVKNTASPDTSSGVKIGLICLHDENSTYDLNFINAFKEACEKTGAEYLIKTNVPESSDAYVAAVELADSGCDIVFADSFGHEDHIIEAAQEFPEVEFCHATGTKAHTEGIANYHNAFASIYEGRYLDGIAAGMKLKQMADDGEIEYDEAKVGYVGAHPYAEVISGYTSFFLGVRRIFPEATMEVTFTGSWYDETAEKEAATRLINDGCVIISGHADSMGAPTACEQNGVPFVFYNGSVEKACPNTYIVSTKINWAPYFEYIINCKQNGEKIAVDWTGTFANGSVEMTSVNEKAAAPGTTEIIDGLSADFRNKSINVFDVNTFTVNGKCISTYMADVDTDPAYKGDTEAISGGYFHESEYRSAPYFDLKIDGIILIDG